MQMTLPKTDITVRTGGTHLELQLPETFMSMLAGKWGGNCHSILALLLLSIYPLPFSNLTMGVQVQYILKNI
jgi:hypothetical protein